MFTVKKNKDEKKWLRGLFKNISCLRLRMTQGAIRGRIKNLKTFHVYG